MENGFLVCKEVWRSFGVFNSKNACHNGQNTQPTGECQLLGHALGPCGAGGSIWGFHSPVAAQASGTTSAMSTNSKPRIFFTSFGGSDVEKPWLHGEAMVPVIGVVEVRTGPGFVRVVDGTVSRKLLVEAHGIVTTITMTNSVVFSSVAIPPLPRHKPINVWIVILCMGQEKTIA